MTLVAPLSRALGRSEQVQGKVEKAGADLSSVNAALDSVAAVAPVAQVLSESRAVEAEVHDAAAELVAVNVALAEEVVERRQLEDQLAKTEVALSESRAEARESRYSALHDAVTGLPNLTLFQDRLRNAIAQAERREWRLAVLFIDLDGFKAVNDTHGHDAGDRVLSAVARRLECIVRDGDTVSRRSGDEFLFLVVDAKGEREVAGLVARIAARIAEPYRLDGGLVALAASIGVARYPDDARSAEGLLEHADAAMYAAKKQRR